MAARMSSLIDGVTTSAGRDRPVSDQREKDIVNVGVGIGDGQSHASENLDEEKPSLIRNSLKWMGYQN